jgi:hypothetical protein
MARPLVPRLTFYADDLVLQVADGPLGVLPPLHGGALVHGLGIDVALQLRLLPLELDELQLQQLRLCRQRAQTVQLLLGRPQRIRQRLDVGVRVSDGGIHVLQLVEQVAVRLDRLRVPGLEVQLVLLQALDALLHLLPLALLAGDIGLMPDKQRLQGKRQRRPFLTTEPAGQGHAGSLTSSRPDQPPRGPRVLRTVSTISARNETSC